jgi:hypothetical protein
VEREWPRRLGPRIDDHGVADLRDHDRVAGAASRQKALEDSPDLVAIGAQGRAVIVVVVVFVLGRRIIVIVSIRQTRQVTCSSSSPISRSRSRESNAAAKDAPLVSMGDPRIGPVRTVRLRSRYALGDHGARRLSGTDDNEECSPLVDEAGVDVAAVDADRRRTWKADTRCGRRIRGIDVADLGRRSDLGARSAAGPAWTRC